jgi:hypothetical protein
MQITTIGRLVHQWQSSPEIHHNTNSIHEASAGIRFTSWISLVAAQSAIFSSAIHVLNNSKVILK